MRPVKRGISNFLVVWNMLVAVTSFTDMLMCFVSGLACVVIMGKSAFVIKKAAMAQRRNKLHKQTYQQCWTLHVFLPQESLFKITGVPPQVDMGEGGGQSFVNI